MILWLMEAFQPLWVILIPISHLVKIKNNYYYDGSLRSEQFDLSGLLGSNNFGTISFNVDIDGQGVELDEIKANAVGEISSLFYKDYEYNEIKLNGAFSSKKFKGDLSIRDEFIALDFNGTINADTTKLVSKFKLDLIEANQLSSNFSTRR